MGKTMTFVNQTKFKRYTFAIAKHIWSRKNPKGIVKIIICFHLFIIFFFFVFCCCCCFCFEWTKIKCLFFIFALVTASRRCL